MLDKEKEFDATLETAAATLRETARLKSEAERGARETAEWKKEHGIDAALEAKFFNAISPEDKKKVEEERETFKREVAQDIEAAIQRAFPAKKTAGAKRSRNMA
ncbi:MAG: hypothetical protein FWG74_02645 [Planctomycetes bacterium]|nr:hypothetical protein [Planctomycetota bacterium]